jgi:hypothetical protein
MSKKPFQLIIYLYKFTLGLNHDAFWLLLTELLRFFDLKQAAFRDAAINSHLPQETSEPLRTAKGSTSKVFKDSKTFLLAQKNATRYDVKDHIATIEIQLMSSVIHNEILEHLCLMKVLCDD